MPKFELPKIDLKNIDLPEVPEVAAKPVYAGVGATDLAVEKVKGYVVDVQKKVADVQKDVTARVEDVQKSVKDFEVPAPKTLQGKAVSVVNARRAQVEAKVAELRADAKKTYDENVKNVTATYADLAKRGETVVTRIRGAEAAVPAPAPKAAPAKAPAAKKAPAKKAPAKKAPAKKAAK